MADVQINYDMVEQTANDLQQGRDYMEGKLSELSGKIKGLSATSGGYRTQIASGVFQDGFAKWRDGMLHIVGGLNVMSEQLHKVVSEHKQLDQGLGGAAGG